MHWFLEPKCWVRLDSFKVTLLRIPWHASSCYLLKKFSLYPFICVEFLASSHFCNISLHLPRCIFTYRNLCTYQPPHRSFLRLGATYLWALHRLDKWMQGWINWWIYRVKRKIKWKLIAKAKRAHLHCTMWGLMHKLELRSTGDSCRELPGFLSLLT